jgi:hypothetical protein
MGLNWLRNKVGEGHSPQNTEGCSRARGYHGVGSTQRQTEKQRFQAAASHQPRQAEPCSFPRAGSVDTDGRTAGQHPTQLMTPEVTTPASSLVLPQPPWCWLLWREPWVNNGQTTGVTPRWAEPQSKQATCLREIDPVEEALDLSEPMSRNKWKY